MVMHKIMIIDEIVVSIHIKPDFFKKLYVFNGIHYFLLFFIVPPPNRMKFLEIHVMPCNAMRPRAVSALAMCNPDDNTAVLWCPGRFRVNLLL